MYVINQSLSYSQTFHDNEYLYYKDLGELIIT